MKLNSDLREFVELWNSAEVEYLIVGGRAVAFHGYPRFTGDIDLWIRPSPDNANRVLQVLVWVCPLLTSRPLIAWYSSAVHQTVSTC